MELIQAAQSGILQDVKDAVSNSKTLIDHHWIDYAALNNAIEYGHSIVAEYLLDIGCRVNIDKELDIHTNTPLHNAVFLEDTALVEKLLEKQASIVATNPDNNTPLHLAFMIRNERLTDLLLDTLQSTNNLINIKNNQGLSHMHIACTRQHSKAVESFVASGVDLNDCMDEDSFLWSGYSALHFAVEFRSLNAVKAILNSTAQADLSIQDGNHGLTALSLARQQLEDLTAIVEFLDAGSKDSLVKSEEDIKNETETKKFSSTGLSAFHMACMENDSELVERFIANGASVHQPVISHIDLFHLYSPLHLAVENKCKRTVAVLLKHGADVNLRNDDRMTPLHLALYVNDHDDKQDIVDYLYAAVGDKLANPEDVNGLSYLHIACTRNDLKTVTYLLDIGEDVDSPVRRSARNVANYTPLHFAVEYRHPEVAKLLIERGAQVDRYSLRGTPLHLACRQGNAELIGLLLDSGARVVDETMSLHPLLEAYANTKDETLLSHVERLVGLGVDVDAKDALGNTALHALSSESDEENERCARFLLDLGADFNLENDEGRTAFEVHRDSVAFYDHAQELETLGVEVNPKNAECCRRMLRDVVFADEETLGQKRQQRIDEITCMKGIKLTKTMALDDFLRLEADDVVPYGAGNEILRLVVSTGNLHKCFPSYAYLIKLQYCRAVGGFGARTRRKRVGGEKAADDGEAKRRCAP